MSFYQYYLQKKQEEEKKKKENNTISQGSQTNNTKPASSFYEYYANKKGIPIQSKTKTTPTPKPVTTPTPKPKEQNFIQKAVSKVTDTFKTKVAEPVSKFVDLQKKALPEMKENVQALYKDNNEILKTKQLERKEKELQSLQSGGREETSYLKLTVIPALQKKVIEIDRQQDERSKKGKKLSSSLEKKRKELQSLIDAPDNDIATQLKRYNELQIIRSKEGRGLKNVGVGLLQSINSMTFDAISWLARDVEPVAKASNKASSKLNEWAMASMPEDPEFADQIAQGFGSAAAFFIPGYGIAKGAGILAKVSPKVALLFGNSVSTALESMSEGASVYKESIEQGKSKKEANIAATKTFWVNSIVIGLTNKFGLFGDSKNKLLRIVGSSSMEGIQEFAQEAISNINTGKDWFNNVIESGIIGVIVGGGLGAATNFSSKTKNIDEQIQQVDKKLSELRQQELNDLKPKSKPTEVEKVKVTAKPEISPEVEATEGVKTEGKEKEAESNIPTVDVGLGFKVEKPVAKAVAEFNDFNTITSGYQSSWNFDGLKPSWAVSFKGSIPTRLQESAIDAGLKVTTRETVKGNKDSLVTDVFLPDVKANELDKAEQVFTSWVDNFYKKPKVAQAPVSDIKEKKQIYDKRIKEITDTLINKGTSVKNKEALARNSESVARSFIASIDILSDKNKVWMKDESLQKIGWIGKETDFTFKANSALNDIEFTLENDPSLIKYVPTEIKKYFEISKRDNIVKLFDKKPITKTAQKKAEIKAEIEAKETVVTDENPIVSKKTGETLNQAIEKLKKNGWSDKDILNYKNAVLNPETIKKPDPNKLNSLNPTGGLLVDYNPQSRMEMELAENITTLDKTSNKSPDEMITIYRGSPSNQKEIVEGDFVTTNYDIAKSYSGEGYVLSKEVKMSDVLDDIEHPLDEEYIYRPAKTNKTELELKTKPITKTAQKKAKAKAEVEAKEDQADKLEQADEDVKKTQAAIDGYQVKFDEKARFMFDKAPAELNKSEFKKVFNEVNEFLVGDESILSKVTTSITNIVYDKQQESRTLSFLKMAYFDKTITNGFLVITDTKKVEQIYQKEREKYKNEDVKALTKNTGISLAEANKLAEKHIKDTFENKDSGITYPTKESVEKIVGKPQDYVDTLFVQGYLPDNITPFVFYSNGKDVITLSSKYVDYFERLYKGNKLTLKAVKDGELKPVGVFADNKMVGVVMPVKINEDTLKRSPIPANQKPQEFIKDKQEKYTVKKAPSGIASGETANIGNYEIRTKDNQIPKDFKLFKKVLELKQKYSDSTIGEGYTPRGALGVYYPTTTNVRVNSMNDLTVASHELSHFLDYKYKITENIDRKTNLKLRQAITKMYVENYLGGNQNGKKHKLRKRVIEGYATLIQKYIETPTTIKQDYPLLVKEFLTEGGQFYNPIIKEFLADTSSIVEQYQSLSNLDKIMARMTNETDLSGKKSFLSQTEKAREFTEDEVLPIEVLTKRTPEVQGTKNDPSLWARAYKAINSVIKSNIFGDNGYRAYSSQEGGYVKKYDFNWNSLLKDLKKVNQLDNFAGYLIARDTHYNFQELAQLKKNRDIIEKNIKDIMEKSKLKRLEVLSYKDDSGVSLGKQLEEAIKEYRELKTILDKNGILETEATGAYNENKERFKAYEEQFDILVREELETLHNSDIGLITQDQYSKLISKKGYASLKRQFYDEIVGEAETMPSFIKVGKTRISTLISRKGSSRPIINPLASSILNHHEVMKKSARQLVYNKVANMVDLNPKAYGDLFQKQQVKVTPDVLGRMTYPQEKDPNLLSARTADGKRKYYLIDAEVKSIIDNILSYENVDIFSAMALGMGRTFTIGTTASYPLFAIPNFLMDQVGAFVNSKNRFIPILTPLNTLRKIMNKNSVDYKYFKEYLDHGGERQTLWGWQRLAPDQLFEAMTKEKNALRKVLGLAEKGVDILGLPSKYSEIITRSSEYIKNRKKGKSIIFSLEEAGRVSVPFHHIGTWKIGKYQKSGKYYIKSVSFFNAGLQVIAQMGKTIGTKEGSKRFAFANMAILSAYIASLALLAAAGSDDQKKQYKDLYVEDLTKYIFIPNPNGKGLIRIRVAEQASVIATIANMYLSSKILDNEYSAYEYLKATTQWLPSQLNPTEPIQMILSWFPQWFKAIGYPILNVKDYPDVRPIESEGMKYLPKGERANEYTSWMAKEIGKKFNISPVKLDALITGVFGRASGFITGKPNVYNLWGSIHRDWYFTMGRTMQDFWDLKAETDQKYSAYQNGKGELSDKEVQELYRNKKLTSDTYKLYQDYKEIDIDKEPEKAQEIRNKILNSLENIENKQYNPPGIGKWIQDATKKRNKNLREKLSQIDNPFKSVVEKLAAFRLVKQAQAAEGITTKIQTNSGLVDMRSPQYQNNLKRAKELKKTHPQWYDKYFGKNGELGVLGKKLPAYNLERTIDIVPEAARKDAKKVIPEFEKALKEQEIYSPKTLAYAMATTQAESSFKPIYEKGEYEYFMDRYDITGSNPELAKDLGNIYPGDGYTFRGRGLIQLTGRSNYDIFEREANIPGLEDNPDLALEPENAAKIMAAFFRVKGVDKKLEEDDYYNARMKVNPDKRAKEIEEYAKKYLTYIQKY